MIHGMDALVQARMSGARPAMVVWLWVGFERGKKGGAAINLEMPRPSLSEDYRGLVGLDVMLCAAEYSPALMEMWELLKPLTNRQMLWVKTWSGDIGSLLIWDKKQGQRTLED
jgi:hypothetical protein